MRTIRSALLIGLAAMILPPAWAADDPAVKEDIARLQGEWSMVSGAANGQPMPAQMLGQMKRVCKGDETTTMMGGQIFMKAKFAIDPSKKPKTIDYQMTDGFTKGKQQLGIYEVDRDTFKACFGKPGAERPTDFTSKPGDGRTLSVWKRANQAAPAPGALNRTQGRASSASIAPLWFTPSRIPARLHGADLHPSVIFGSLVLYG